MVKDLFRAVAAVVLVGLALMGVASTTVLTLFAADVLLVTDIVVGALAIKSGATYCVSAWGGTAVLNAVRAGIPHAGRAANRYLMQLVASQIDQATKP